jgi:ceramide glucosyltransferase
MVAAIADALLWLAGAGVLLLALQVGVLVRHVRVAPPRSRELSGISVLKPLCGIDDDLLANLATFAQLDYPRYEVLLGVRNASDPAYAIAREAAARWPGLMRVVLQRGEPGLNPKVNQLITLAQHARHDVLAISDSNVAAYDAYLQDIAAYLDDPSVGLVTHPVMGVGERTLGSLFDNTHLSAGIAPGMVAARQLADFPIVVGKSMALRRCDLRVLGGFASVKDVLAEDFVLGQRVVRELDKQVTVAHRSIAAVSRERNLGGFFDRYARWATIQRTSVGLAMYSGILLLNPLPFALAAAAVQPGAAAFAMVAAVWAAKALLEHVACRTLRGAGPGALGLLALPLKDLLLWGAFWLGIWRSEVVWRGNRLAVLSGTRLLPVPARRSSRWRSAPASVLLFAARFFR